MLLGRIEMPAPAKAETPVLPPGVDEEPPRDGSTRITGSDNATRVVAGPGKEPVIDDEATRIASGPTPRPPLGDEATRVASRRTVHRP